MTKALSKVNIEGTYLNIIKVIYDKPTANIILRGKAFSFSPLRLEEDKDVPLATFVQYSIGSPSHSSKVRKRNRRNPNQKGKSKTILV